MKWIGNVPEIVSKLKREEMVDYFCYIFEYSFDKNNTKGTTPKEIISNIYLKLSHVKENEKLWCAMALLTLKYIADINQYYYTISVIDKLLISIDKINVNELEDYMNRVNEGIIADGVPALIIRPFEIINICGREIAEYNGYSIFIDQKEKILNIAYKYIDEKNINTTYINNILLFDRKASLQYADMVTQWTELFISFFKMSYLNISTDPKYKNIPIEKKIEPLVTAFCSATFKKKKLERGFIEELTTCLNDILK